MNRDTRMWIVVGIAVLTAAAATFGIFIALPKGPKEPPKVFVVVAKRNLAMGSTVSEADVRVVKWPDDSQVAGAFPAINDVKDKALVASVLENEPITKSKLAEAGAGLTPIIQKGYRAISVKVNEVIGVAGFVTPGTRVDVLATIRQDKDAKARVVVQNVEVLTAGAKYDDPEGRKQGKPIPSTVVTLMVTPEDSERIAVAATQGTIILALRNPMDKVMARTSGVTGVELMAGDRPLVAAVPKTIATPTVTRPTARTIVRDFPPPTARPPCQVETFKAGKREVLPCS